MMYRLAFVCLIVLNTVDGRTQYEDKLTKLWSMANSRSDNARTAVLNVTSASMVIEPTSYNEGVTESNQRLTRQAKMPKYAFRPRSIPIKDQSQLERSIHYVEEKKPKDNSDILFPGNYFKISEVKREENATEDSSFNPLDGVPFHPKIIPLMRDEYKKRSLENEEPTIENPNGYSEPAAMRRSIASYLIGGDDDDEEDEDDDELVEVDVTPESDDGKNNELRHKLKKKKFKIKKKYAKYMLPLLIAYKLKFFAMIPLMMGGLVLLVGATGLAGFFFALFAAVMGLQKGSY